jgi:hypothetical protein
MLLSRITLVFVLALGVLGAGTASAGDLTQTIAVSGPGRLVLDLDRGNVDVLTHDQSSVHVQARAHGLGASSVHFTLEQSGKDVVLHAKTDEWVEYLNAGPRIQIDIWAPASLEIVCASERALVTRRDAVEVSYPTRVVGNAAP